MSSVWATEYDEVPEPVTAELFRSVFRDHAARVVIVTAPGRRGPVGFTATSLTSLSLVPPMVSVAVARSASVWATVARSRRIGVHLLGHDQHLLAKTFATSGIDRFAKVRWHPAPGGEPLLEDCPAYLCCEVVKHVSAGDHVLVLARVSEARVDRTGSPLVYHDGAYASVRPVVDDPATPISWRSLAR
jgi:flavin reductase (DIM6/NTAB) family NADH-FMN oxidoreductase RutF